jgi:hypothetical protein
MSAPVAEVLLVRGAPGVGKSSAVRAARKLLPDGAIVEVDDLRGMIAAVRWSDRLHHELALAHAALLVNSFLAKGFTPVLIVDTFSRGLADPFARTLGRPYRIASLVADADTLRQRIEGRPANQFRDHDVSLALNAQTRHDRFEHDVLVDTTGLRADEVAARLASIVRGEL